MDSQMLVDAINNFGWIGFGLAVVVFLLTNDSFTSLFLKLADRFTKSNEIQTNITPYKFELLKLSRPSNRGTRKLILFINFLYLAIFIFAYEIAWIKHLGNTIVLWSAIGIFIETFSLCDLFITRKIKITLTVSGDTGLLFRTYQAMLVDMKMSLLSFDAQSKEIKAFLNGNQIQITINPGNDSENMVTFTIERDFQGIVIYSKEFQRNIRKLLNIPYYPKI